MDKKDVYLCYNSADRPWVEELAAQLESETIDGNVGSRRISVFFDQWDMNAGDSLINKMNEGLAAADFVTTILTPEFLDAPWPEFEWKHIVAADPTNSAGRLIPIVRRMTSLDGKKRIELIAPFRDLKWIDFCDDSLFKRNFGELVRRIRRQANPRGGIRPPLVPGTASHTPKFTHGSSWHPDSVEEMLPSNLLPVASMPRKIFCAPTSYRKHADIWNISKSVPPFILKGGMLYTFSDLANPEELLAEFVTSKEIRSVQVDEWLKDLKTRRWLVELLNRCLSNHFWCHGLKNIDHRYYFPPKEGELRKVRTMSGFNRSVAKKIGTEHPMFWFHMGCRANFTLLGDTIAILVDPCFLFTVDGASPVGGKAMGKLCQIWGGKQQNDHILRDILFWFDVIKGPDPDEGIYTGSSPIYLNSLSLFAATIFGVEGDRINFKALRKMEGDDLSTIVDEML